MIKDGIYFSMPEDEYHAEERLSKSGIKRLRISPADFWHDSWLNPEPEALTPEQERSRFLARVIGRAYHCARLEPERFAATYVREISQADFAKCAGFLSNGDQIGKELEARGQTKKKSGETVLDQAKRLREAGYTAPIWHLEEDAMRAALMPHQILIPGKIFDEIAVDMARLRSVPAVSNLLTGGAPEVSIFWTCEATGIPMKARIDYLQPWGWVEFKTFSNPNGKSLMQTVIDAVRFNRYHIDAAAYLEALQASRGLPIIGPATQEQVAIIQALRELEHPPECRFIFQQKGGVPNILERSFRLFDGVSEQAVRDMESTGAHPDKLAKAEKMRRHTTVSATALLMKARMEIAAAKRDFLAYSDIYQRGEPWLPFNPSGEIVDADFSQYFLEEQI